MVRAFATTAPSETRISSVARSHLAAIALHIHVRA
jgi:hypothetical protein